MKLSAVNTLPKLLLSNYKKYGGEKIAMKRKRLGIWTPYSWRDYYETVKYLSLGLVKSGINQGDKLAVIGDNAPEIYWAQLAIQAIGGAVVPLYSDSTSEEIRYVLEHSDSKVIVAEDQEQIDKILEIIEGLPLLMKVIYWDSKGMRQYDHPLLLPLEQILEVGRDYCIKNPDHFHHLVDRGRGDNLACIFYTSGTTGLPKGTMHTHSALISTSQRWFEFDPCQQDFEYLSMLSPAWGGEEYAGVVDQLLSGMCVDFPEEPETLQENFREISPQISFFGVRQLEGIISDIQLRILDANPFKRFFYRLLIPIGYEVAERRSRGQNSSLFWRILCALAYLILHRPIKDRFGFSKAKWVYTGGALVNPDVLEFFHALGIMVKPIYGLSESGVCAYHTDDVKLHSTGRPGPGIEIRISEDSEILLRSDTMFKGYYKEPELTAKRVTGGWFHTGDAGHFDEEGYLIIIDRIEDLMELAGAKFSPQFIEANLRYSPYVKDAVAFGDRKSPYVVVIIDIDYGSVGKWAEQNHIPYTTFIDLSQKAQVYELIENEVRRVNRILPKQSGIRRFCLLHKELDADDAELTRTRKLKRNLLRERYGFMIDAMYKDESEVMAEAEVKYRDGRSGRLVTTIQIRTTND